MVKEERFLGASWAQGRQSPSQTEGTARTLLEETYHKELAWWHELPIDRRKKGSEGGGKKEGKGGKEEREEGNIY